jgi:hypothetical protein
MAWPGHMLEISRNQPSKGEFVSNQIASCKGFGVLNCGKVLTFDSGVLDSSHFAICVSVDREGMDWTKVKFAREIGEEG